MQLINFEDEIEINPNIIINNNGKKGGINNNDNNNINTLDMHK